MTSKSVRSVNKKLSTWAIQNKATPANIYASNKHILKLRIVLLPQVSLDPDILSFFYVSKQHISEFVELFC